MHRERNPNIEILEIAVDALGPLAHDMVFLGGCATGLLLTDVAAPPIRATQDVDVITEAASLADYHRLSEQLRERGFTEDQSPEAPICRWTAKGNLLDVMPTNPDILGFGNEWYQPALDAAEYVGLPSGNKIRMVTAPYFIATKLSAFDGRGKGDYLMSHDVEDIVAVLDGRLEVFDEVQASTEELRSHLAELPVSKNACLCVMAMCCGAIGGDLYRIRRGAQVNLSGPKFVFCQGRVHFHMSKTCLSLRVV